MSRLTEMVKESQSGPELYTDMGDRVITLGTFIYIFSEIGDALYGAMALIDEMDKDVTIDARPQTLMTKLGVQHAIDCLNEIYPSKDKDGREFWTDKEDRKKITFVDPFGGIIKRYVANAKQVKAAESEQIV